MQTAPNVQSEAVQALTSAGSRPQEPQPPAPPLEELPGSKGEACAPTETSVLRGERSRPSGPHWELTPPPLTWDLDPTCWPRFSRSPHPCYARAAFVRSVSPPGICPLPEFYFFSPGNNYRFVGRCKNSSETSRIPFACIPRGNGVRVGTRPRCDPLASFRLHRFHRPSPSHGAAMAKRCGAGGGGQCGRGGEGRGLRQ